jgi:hypothetical protein
MNKFYIINVKILFQKIFYREERLHFFGQDEAKSNLENN